MLTGALDAVWVERPADVTVDDLVTDERKHASQVSDHDAADHTFKVNDLYLRDPDVRRVASRPGSGRSSLSSSRTSR